MRLIETHTQRGKGAERERETEAEKEPEAKAEKEVKNIYIFCFLQTLFSFHFDQKHTEHLFVFHVHRYGVL